MNPNKSAEDVTTHRIEMRRDTPLMSINTTSLVFARDGGLGVLNFWLERETHYFRDEEEEEN